MNSQFVGGNPGSIPPAIGLGIALLLSAIAWVGAIIRLGQLRRWEWFITLLALAIFFLPLGVVAFVLYLFIGPDTASGQPFFVHSSQATPSHDANV